MTLQKRSKYIYILLSLVFVLSLGAMVFITQKKTSEIISTLALERGEAAKQSLLNYLDELADRAEPRAKLLAGRPRFRDAVKDNDFDSLREFLVEFVEGFDYMSICDGGGIVLARSDNSEFGHNLSSNPDIKEVLRTGLAVKSISLTTDGKVETGAHVPVYDGDDLIGIITCTFDLSKSEYLDVFKMRTGCEASIFLGSERIATTLIDEDGNRRIGTKANESVIEAILIRGDENYAGKGLVFDAPHYFYYMPFTFDGEVIGILGMSLDLDSAEIHQRDMNRWTIVIAALGLVASLVMVFLSIKYNRALTELSRKTAMLDEREYTQLLLDATPMSCILWDAYPQIVNCNQECLKLFEANSEQELVDRFWEFSPELQPCGESSVEKGIKTIKEAFRKGSLRVEWMHQTLDGKPLPCDIIFVRLTHKGEDLVASYAKRSKAESRSLSD